MTPKEKAIEYLQNCGIKQIGCYECVMKGIILNEAINIAIEETRKEEQERYKDVLRIDVVAMGNDFKEKARKQTAKKIFDEIEPNYGVDSVECWIEFKKLKQKYLGDEE